MSFAEILKKNSKDILAFSSLAVIFMLFSLIFYSHQGSVIIDCGRDPYIAERILKGDILYKDIFALYAPLSYQLNALLYFMFGISLKILYFAGLINSFFILLLIYLISRTIASTFTAWTCSFFVICEFIFNYYISSYAFPYSYAMVYALCAFLAGVLFCVYYLKTNKPGYILLAFLFAGLSTAFKVDFSLFIAVLVLISLWIKPISRMNLAKGLFLLTAFPIASWLVLFYQGLTVPDTLKYFNDIGVFLNTHSHKYFYLYFTGFYYRNEFIKYNVEQFFNTLFSFGIPFAGIYFILILGEKFKNIPGVKYIKFFLIIFLFIFLQKNFFKECYHDRSFSWISFSAIFILLFFLIKNFRNNSFKFNSLNEKIFIFILICSILASFKSFFLINFHIFGNFLASLLFLVNITFFVEYFPNLFNFIDAKKWKTAFLIILIFVSFTYFRKNFTASKITNTYKIQTSKGTIHTNKVFSSGLLNLVYYIKRNLDENSSFVMIPEGIMLNFLTDKPLPTKYCDFIPNYIEAFQDDMIAEFEENKPEYFFITTQETTDYGFKYFGKDYGFGIMSFINNNYVFVKKLGIGLYTIKVYRLEKK